MIYDQVHDQSFDSSWILGVIMKKKDIFWHSYGNSYAHEDIIKYSGGLLQNNGHMLQMYHMQGLIAKWFKIIALRMKCLLFQLLFHDWSSLLSSFLICHVGGTKVRVEREEANSRCANREMRKRERNWRHREKEHTQIHQSLTEDRKRHISGHNNSFVWYLKSVKSKCGGTIVLCFRSSGPVQSIRWRNVSWKGGKR